MYNVGTKVRVNPRVWSTAINKWTFKGNEKSIHFGWIGEVMQISQCFVTVKFLHNTNLGWWSFNFSPDELVVVDSDTPITNISEMNCRYYA